MEVRREEMEEVWDTTMDAIKQFGITLKKPYKYSSWITNVSLGLLGFYIAFLLQIKSIVPFTDKTQILVNLIILIVPVAIGVFYRFKYEVVEIYKSAKEFFENLKTFLQTIDEKFQEKGVNTIDSEGINNIDLSWRFIEKWSKTTIFTGITLQFLFFLMGLSIVMIHLLNYLFS